MAVAAGDVFRLAQHFEGPEQVQAFNILALKCVTGTCTDAELLAAASTWLKAAYDECIDLISDQVTMSECRVTRMIWSVNKWLVTELIGSVLNPSTFAETTDMLPHAVAAVPVFATAKPTSRGRVNIFGVGESEQEDGLWNSTAVADITAFAGDLRSVLAPGSATLYYAILGDDGTARTTTSAVVTDVPGSQRRRKPGVGI